MAYSFSNNEKVFKDTYTSKVPTTTTATFESKFAREVKLGLGEKKVIDTPGMKYSSCSITHILNLIDVY